MLIQAWERQNSISGVDSDCDIAIRVDTRYSAKRFHIWICHILNVILFFKPLKICKSKRDQLGLILDAIFLDNPLLHGCINQDVLVHGNGLDEQSIFNKYLAFLVPLGLNDDLSFISILSKNSM